MSQAPQVSPEALRAAPVIAEQTPQTGGNVVLRFSMAVDRMQKGLQGAPARLAERFADRRGLSDESKTRLVKGAAAVGVFAVAYSQRKVLGEIIDGVDFDPFNFVEDAHAQTGGSTTTTTEHEPTTTTTEHEPTTTTTEPDVTTTTEAPTTTTAPDSDVDAQPPVDADPADVDPADTDAADPADHVSLRDDAEADFLDAADDTDRFGNTFYGEEDHLNESGDPMTAEEFVEQATTEELRSSTKLAHAMDTATIDQVDDLQDYLDDGDLNGSVTPVGEVDADPADVDPADTDAADPADHVSLRDDAEADFLDAADDTDRNGDPLYDPELHLDEDGNPMTAEEFAEQATTEELRNETDLMHFNDTATGEERAAMREFLGLETEVEADANGDGHYGDLVPETSSEALSLYGVYGDEESISFQVNPGETVHDAIRSLVIMDMPNASDNRQESIAANLQAIFEASNPDVDPLANVDELMQVELDIPQAN